MSVDNGEADTLSGSKRVCQVEETNPREECSEGSRRMLRTLNYP